MIFKSGFSLIELLITLSLLGLIAFLFNRNMIWSCYGTDKIELEKFYTIAIYLQKKAVLHNKKEILSINFKDNSYAHNNTVYKLDKNVVWAKKSSFKDDKIIFYPDGIISSGTIYLSNINNANLYKITCSVGTINYLRKYKYNNISDNWILLN